MSVIIRVDKRFKGKYKSAEELQYDTRTGKFFFGNEFIINGNYTGMGSDDGVRGIIEKLKHSLEFMEAVNGSR